MKLRCSNAVSKFMVLKIVWERTKPGHLQAMQYITQRKHDFASLLEDKNKIDSDPNEIASIEVIRSNITTEQEY